MNTWKEALWMVGLMAVKPSLSPPDTLPFSPIWPMFTSPKHLLLAKFMNTNIHTNRMAAGNIKK